MRALHETAATEAAALDRIWWLLGLIGGILTEERFTQLEKLIMINPERQFVPRTEFERQPFNRGRAEGKAEALLRVLAARNLSPTDAQRQALLGCQDQAQLERWLDASVTAPSIAALLGIK